MSCHDHPGKLCLWFVAFLSYPFESEWSEAGGGGGVGGVGKGGGWGGEGGLDPKKRKKKQQTVSGSSRQRPTCEVTGGWKIDAKSAWPEGTLLLLDTSRKSLYS